jgi:hypothetical protein
MKNSESLMLHGMPQFGIRFSSLLLAHAKRHEAAWVAGAASRSQTVM